MSTLLETQRLILRTWQASDFEPMCEINQDPKVMECFPSTLSKEETRTFIDKLQQHYEQHSYTFFAVELKQTGECIGFVGLKNVSFQAHFTPAVEIGWRLSSAHWGQGYATEAAKAVLDFAFNQLQLKEIVSFTTVANIKSRRVMEKIGLLHDPQDDFQHPKLASTHPLCRHVLYRLSKNST